MATPKASPGDHWSDIGDAWEQADAAKRAAALIPPVVVTAHALLAPIIPAAAYEATVNDIAARQRLRPGDEPPQFRTDVAADFRTLANVSLYLATGAFLA